MGATENPLSVSLTMAADTQTQLTKHMTAVELANSFVIDSPEMAQEAANQIKQFKGGVKWIKEKYDGFVEPARTIIENARSLFRPSSDALEQGIAILTTKLTTYQEQERKRVEEENRRAEESARKARQEAEQRAAAERARAAEKAEADRRAAEEAEQLKLEAQAKGDAKAAAAAAAEAAKLTERAAAVEENAAIKADTVVVAAAAAAPVVVAPTKIAGFGTRKNFKAQLVAGYTEQQVILKIAAELPTRPDLVKLLALDMTYANKLAKAQEEAMNVPGLRAVNVPIATSR